jgi:hypothetical protein
VSGEKTVSNRSFSFGDQVRVVSGRYAGMTGVVVDPGMDSDALPPPLPGYYWIRVAVQNLLIPLHVRGDEISALP